MILLAEDDVGYRNLLALTTAAHLNGYYYKPRIDKELLAQHMTTPKVGRNRYMARIVSERMDTILQ